MVSDNLLVFTVGNIYKDPLTHIWQGSFMFFSAAPTHLCSTYVYLGWHLFLALRSRRSGDWASPPARCSSKPPTSQKASHSKLRGTSLPPHYVPLLERQTPNAPLAHSATPPLRWDGLPLLGSASIDELDPKNAELLAHFKAPNRKAARRKRPARQRNARARSGVKRVKRNAPARCSEVSEQGGEMLFFWGGS